MVPTGSRMMVINVKAEGNRVSVLVQNFIGSGVVRVQKSNRFSD